MFSFHEKLRFRSVKFHRERRKIFLVLFVIIFCSFVYHVTFNSNDDEHDREQLSMPFFHFMHQNNSKANPKYLVPNIVHFIRFNQSEVTFVDAACILAALKHQNPDIIYFHINTFNLTGKYWNYLLKFPRFQQIYKIHHIELPKYIFGQKFRDMWWLQHASDVTRIRVLMQYGGIFLDNDSYVIKCLDIYRRYEMVLGWDDYFKNLGTQILLAHPNARFLKLWLEFYRNNYNASSWYYNAGTGPSDYILAKNPNLVFNVSKVFGVNVLGHFLYQSCNWEELQTMYAIHFLINHRYYLDPYNFYFHKVEEENVIYMNNTFGEIIRTTFWGNDYVTKYLKVNETRKCLNPV